MLGGMSGEMLRRKDSRTNTLFGFSGRGTLDWLNKKITEGMCSPAGELNFFRIKNNNEKLSRTLHHIIYFCAHIPSLFFPSPKDFCTNLYTCSAMPPREEARLRRSARQAAAAAAANGQSEANPLPQRSPVLVEETPTTTPSIPGTPLRIVPRSPILMMTFVHQHQMTSLPYLLLLRQQHRPVLHS